MSARHSYSVAVLAFGVFAAACPLSLAQDVKDAVKAEPTHYKLAFENDSVQVISVHYGPHEKSKLHSHPGGVVVVLTPGHLRFTDEDGKTREVNALRGEARWFAPLKHSVENLGNAPYDAVYVVVKQGRKSAQTVPSGVPDVRATAPAPDKTPLDKLGPSASRSALVHK